MKSIITLALVIFASHGFATQVQFIGGNQIQVDSREGIAHVRCDSGRTEFRSYNCYESSLSIGDYSGIEVIAGSVDADWVKLQRVGSKYIKGVKFNAETGKSSKRVNLWVSTLFQRPLLKRGTNTIRYTFSKNKKEVLTGEFTAEVVTGEELYCRGGTMWYSYCPSAMSACRDFLYRRSRCN